MSLLIWLAAAPLLASAPGAPERPSNPTSSPMAADQAGGEAEPPPEIVVSAPLRPSKIDPLEKVNIRTFSVMQDADRTVIMPVADGYRRAVPAPVRDGLHNLLSNLDEPIIFLNFVAQHKVGKAGDTVGRFAINSTLGIGGLFDVARKRPFHLPHRPTDSPTRWASMV